MNALPYELLQHIASSLLPRYQCRLAMASKWCYRYLYTPLLRWHARKSPILPPRYKYERRDGYIYSYMSLVEFNKQLVLYVQIFSYRLYAYNLTHLYVTSIENYMHSRNEIDIGKLWRLYYFMQKSNILIGCYKYIHKMPLIMYLSSRHPLISMPDRILDTISNILTDSDRDTFISSSTYLSYVYG